MEEQLIEPFTGYRDNADLVVSIAVGLLQSVFFIVVPIYVGRLLSDSWLIGVAVAIVWNAWMTRYIVEELSVTDHALHFVRQRGWPRAIPWSEVQSIEIAPRAELVWHGWLWPIFPAREMTVSQTSVGHYRIRYLGGFAYFAPADPAAFEAALQSHWAGAMEQKPLPPRA